MSDFRIRYGSAYGPFGTAAATSSQNLLPPQDATPEVTNGTFFVTNNTSAVTYTYFDVLGDGGVVSTAHNGKWIRILFQDANTTVQNGGNIYLTDTQGALPTGSILDLMFYNSGWYEAGRSVNDQTPQAHPLRIALNIAATMGSLNITTADYAVLTATAANAVIRGFVGGVSGSTVRLFLSATGGQSIFFAESAGVLTIAGTGTFLASPSAFYTIATRNGQEWHMEPGLVSP